MNSQNLSQEEFKYIHDKLITDYSDSDLLSFCQNYFIEVFQRFGSGQNHDEKITLLVDYCRRDHNRWAKLKQLLEEEENHHKPIINTRDAYLLSIIRLYKDWEKKYISIAGEPANSTLEKSDEINGFIPSSLAAVYEKHFPSEKRVKCRDFEKIEEAIDTFPQFILIGKPGAGKTTIMRKLLSDAARDALNNPEKPIPFFIRLGKDWSEDTEEFPELLQRIYRTHSMRTMHPSEIFILLDGLNEIPAQYRKQRITELENWVSTHRDTKVVISCRTGYDLSSFLAEYPRVKINPLDNDLILQYMAMNLGEEDAAALFDKLQPNPDQQSPRDLIRLARNPYFLAIITYIYKKRHDLPTSQGTLFQMFVEILYSREVEKGTTSNLSLEDLIIGLGSVAQSMYELGITSSKLDIVWGRKQLSKNLKVMSDQLWLLGREMGLLEFSREGKLIEFTHDLISEYFTAEYFQRYPEKLSLLLCLPQIFNGRRLSSTIDTIVYMMAGITSADQLLPLILEADPFLAVRSLDFFSDENSPEDSLIDKTLQVLIDQISKKDENFRTAVISEIIHFPYQNRVHSLAEMYLRIGKKIEKRSFIKVLKNCDDVEKTVNILVFALKDKDKWVRRDAAEVLIELGEISLEPLYRLYQNDIPTRTQREIVKISALIPSEQNFHFLVEALNSPDANIAQEASNALSALDEEQTAAIIEDVIYRRNQARNSITSHRRSERESALVILSALGTAEDADRLVELLPQIKDHAFLCKVIDTIGQLCSSNNEHIVDNLIAFLEGYDMESLDLISSPRVAAVYALGLIRNERAVSSIERTLEDENHFLRSTAAQALGRIRSSTALNSLIKCCQQDKNGHVIAYAALSLGLIGDLETIPILVGLLTANKSIVRSYAAWAIALFRQTNQLPQILDLLYDSSTYTRQCAITSLAILRDAGACDPLGKFMMKNHSIYELQWAALSLGAIGHPNGLNALEFALHSSSEYVRHKAIAAIGEIQHPSSILLIKQAIDDEDRFCRQQAALAFGRLQASDQAEELIGLSNDSSEYVRAAAVQSSGEIKDPQTITFLCDMLKNDPSYLVRRGAAVALGNFVNYREQFVSDLRFALDDKSDFVRKGVVDSIGKLEFIEFSNELAEQLQNEPSIYVRRMIIKVLDNFSKKSDLFKTQEKRNVIQVALSDKDPYARKLAARLKKHSEVDFEESDMEPQSDSEPFIASRKSPHEDMRRKLEQGEIHELIRQAILEPRRSKREAAQAVLWPKTEE